MKTTYVNTAIGRLKFYCTNLDGNIENITLTQALIKPTLPQGMSVTECIAVLLQFSATKTVTEFCFCCDWEDFDGVGYANPGEWLDAWELQHEKHLVMIGTEGAEFLSSRIPLLPFEPLIYPITMEQNKIKIRLREISPGDSYSLHFIVSTNCYPEAKEASCWFSVDLSHENVKEWLLNTDNHLNY